MAARGHRRQVLLFLIAIILPCAMLVVLGVRMLVQDRELGEKRAADQRRGVAGQLRRELAALLDRTVLGEASAVAADSQVLSSRRYQSPLVVLVARVTDGRLALPWERDPRGERFRRLLQSDPFARLVAQGERAELAARHPEEAIRVYTEALAAARAPAQLAYARLLRGRAAFAAGRRVEGLGDLHSVLQAPLGVVDEHGVPLALYAATRLVDLGSGRRAVAGRAREAMEAGGWLSPAALYLLRDLVDSLRASADPGEAGVLLPLADSIATRIARAEQALGLQRDLARLAVDVGGARTPDVQRRWVSFGEPLWLVGTAAPPGGAGELVVAVSADAVFAAVRRTVAESGGGAGTLVVSSAGEAGGEPLGAGFPEFAVRFPLEPGAPEPGWAVRRWFIVVALFLVLSVTLFGAYLVSRDVRRELRLVELRSRFVSAVSHELKTPLTAIRMYAETLQLGRTPDPEARTAYLETIVNECERLTRLLNNILDFTKIERGGKEYRRVPEDLADIVGASARAMRYPLEQQRFTLEVHVDEGLPAVSVDRDAIEQAILNLLSNAMKYSGTSRAIGLRLRRADAEAVIEVADHGIGIAPTEQERIFEQFYRVPTQANDGIPGTGLGLTLVRHITEGHGGRVSVASVPGEGSTFAVHLPLEERSA